MAGKGVTRRLLMLMAAMPPAASNAPRPRQPTVNWTALTQELHTVELGLQVTVSELAVAERRFFALRQSSQDSPEPSWLLAAQHAEASATTAFEDVCRRLSETPARSRAALDVKARLIATLSGMRLEASEDDDAAARLLKSLIRDLSINIEFVATEPSNHPEV
jgi:hypothetical protein